VLWVLRDVLGMMGTKFGCGAGLCGACLVHVDGKPTRSCVTPIETVGAAEVTTIEAIGKAGSDANCRRCGLIWNWCNAATASRAN
jgi:isoquinoline 1-oxidoreductase alpha subunit